MHSKEVFKEEDRKILRTLRDNNQLNKIEHDLFLALEIAEFEIESLRERLHNANVEISNLIDLRPEN